MSLTCHEEMGRVGQGCYEDVTRKLHPWNLGLNQLLTYTDKLSGKQAIVELNSSAVHIRTLLGNKDRQLIAVVENKQYRMIARLVGGVWILSLIHI